MITFFKTLSQRADTVSSLNELLCSVLFPSLPLLFHSMPLPCPLDSSATCESQMPLWSRKYHRRFHQPLKDGPQALRLGASSWGSLVPRLGCKCWWQTVSRYHILETDGRHTGTQQKWHSLHSAKGESTIPRKDKYSLDMKSKVK